MNVRHAAAAAGFLFVASICQAADRFPILKPDQLAPEQAKIVQSLLASPRAGGGGSEATPENMAKMIRGPFNAYLRSPDIGMQIVKLAEQVRFHSSLPPRLNEFAILITARHWNSAYEWFAHEPLALKGGLDPKVSAQLAQNTKPRGMKEEEAAVYDFCTQLHRNHKVTDAAYKRVLGLFGEQGVMDLIAVSGLYDLVSMTLNVAEVPVPAGRKNPFK
jgi:4-carboxymuconolactone decarboxylase